MNIALDYDGTFTADPVFWLRFVRNALDAGHVVYCVTMLEPHQTHDMDFELQCMVKVITTSSKAKKPFVDALGIKIDIWIDDRPDWIINDAWIPNA